MARTTPRRPLLETAAVRSIACTRRPIGLSARSAESLYRDGRPEAMLRMDTTDHGIVLRHGDGPGECDGLPSVVRAGNRPALFYDASCGNSTSHLRRNIGLAWLELPLSSPSDGQDEGHCTTRSRKSRFANVHRGLLVLRPSATISISQNVQGAQPTLRRQRAP